MRAGEVSKTRARCAKPEGAKRPSSPAGLAGRSAERACKLVIDNIRLSVIMRMVEYQECSGVPDPALYVGNPPLEFL